MPAGSCDKFCFPTILPEFDESAAELSAWSLSLP